MAGTEPGLQWIQNLTWLNVVVIISCWWCFPLSLSREHEYFDRPMRIINLICFQHISTVFRFSILWCIHLHYKLFFWSQVNCTVQPGLIWNILLICQIWFVSSQYVIWQELETGDWRGSWLDYSVSMIAADCITNIDTALAIKDIFNI